MSYKGCFQIAFVLLVIALGLLLGVVLSQNTSATAAGLPTPTTASSCAIHTPEMLDVILILSEPGGNDVVASLKAGDRLYVVGQQEYQTVNYLHVVTKRTPSTDQFVDGWVPECFCAE